MSSIDAVSSAGSRVVTPYTVKKVWVR